MHPDPPQPPTAGLGATQLGFVPTISNQLPEFQPACSSSFFWGTQDTTANFTSLLETAYTETVHWKNNLFKIPQGNAGKSFTQELSRLFSAFATCSALEPIALKAASVLPVLILQRPHYSSKIKAHIQCITKRLALWNAGDLSSLLEEGRAIQDRLHKTFTKRKEQQLSRSFAKLMFEGKTHAALQLLSDKGKGGFLHLKDKVGTPPT